MDDGQDLSTVVRSALAIPELRVLNGAVLLAKHSSWSKILKY